MFLENLFFVPISKLIYLNMLKRIPKFTLEIKLEVINMLPYKADRLFGIINYLEKNDTPV